MSSAALWQYWMSDFGSNVLTYLYLSGISFAGLVRMHWLSVTFLIKALPTGLLNLDGQPTLRRVVVVPFFIHFTSVEATELLRTLKALQMGSYPCLDLCLATVLSQRSTESLLDFMAWSLSWHAVWIVLIVYSIQSATGRLQLSSRYISRQNEQDATDHNLEYHRKGSKYVCKWQILVFDF